MVKLLELAAWCGRKFESFDTKVIDRAAIGGTGAATRSISKFTSQVDAWGIGIPFRVLAGIVEAISLPVRRIQTGFLQDYLLFAALGLVAILGYFLHLAHRVAH
jgi:hypothetical protein